MTRIIYLCPSDNTPTGGVKVIYRHTEILCAQGADAFVLHPFDTTFQCTWFEHEVPFLTSLALAPNDFVILPEIYAGVFGPQCQQQGVRYAIFVQNGYISHPILPQIPGPVLTDVYTRASLVLVISKDTAEMVSLNYPAVNPRRILGVQYSVHHRFVRAACAADALEEPTITYMPRKMASHAERVVFALSQSLPVHWRIIPIDGVDEATCATMLSASRIFLSFSDFEGLPLPPLEAALCGNFVVGYTGQGAREYWRAPNFEEIQQGDIIGFVRATVRLVEHLDQGTLDREALRPAIDQLAAQYSLAAETESVAGLRRRIDSEMM